VNVECVCLFLLAFICGVCFRFYVHKHGVYLTLFIIYFLLTCLFQYLFVYLFCLFCLFIYNTLWITEIISLWFCARTECCCNIAGSSSRREMARRCQHHGTRWDISCCWCQINARLDSFRFSRRTSLWLLLELDKQH
jgi:hypothetical protein